MIVNTIEYPQPSEFAIRARAIPNIPRGDGGYPTTLKTIIDMLKSDTPIDTPLSIPGSSSSCTLKDACIVLRATRIIIKTRSGFTPSEEAIRWRDSNDSMYLSALLSARVCFFSAMLDALRNPKTSAELLELANTVYGMGWKKRSEINRRLSWALDLNLIEYRPYDANTYLLTQRGLDLLDAIEIETPITDEPNADEKLERPSDWAIALIEEDGNQKKDSIGYIAGENTAIALTIHGTLAQIGKSASARSIVQFMQDQFGISSSSTKSFLGALTQLGFIRRISESNYGCTPLGLRWVETPTSINLAFCFHAAFTSVLEIISLLAESQKSINDLDLDIQIKLGNSSITREGIRSRLHILSNAKLIRKTSYSTWTTTELGKEILSLGNIKPYLNKHLNDEEMGSSSEIAKQETSSNSLIEELWSAGRDSANPDRLEKAVANAFAQLGFATQLIGGSGNTDVLASANVAERFSYSIAVDAKSSGSGNVDSSRVDFDTLDAHKTKHGAKYSAVVGASFTEERVIQRAITHGVVLIEIEQLGRLLSLQNTTPLNAQDLEPLFAQAGKLDLALIDNARQRVERNGLLLFQVMKALLQESKDPETEGVLTSRDIYLLCRGANALQGLTQNEIGDMLEFLSSPIIGCIGKANGGFYAISSHEEASKRFSFFATACVKAPQHAL